MFKGVSALFGYPEVLYKSKPIYLSSPLFMFSQSEYNIFFILIGCGGVYTAPQGNIISPGYPNNHLHNLECVWTISVPSADRIVLYFNDFDMELASK